MNIQESGVDDLKNACSLQMSNYGKIKKWFPSKYQI